MPNPKHQPTPEMRAAVTAWAILHQPHHQMVPLFKFQFKTGISIKTLLKHYRDELDLGKAKAVTEASGQLMKKVKSGNLGAIIFFLKAQAGWREVQVTETRFPGGKVPANGKNVTINVSSSDAAKAYKAMIDGDTE